MRSDLIGSLLFSPIKKNKTLYKQLQMCRVYFLRNSIKNVNFHHDTVTIFEDSIT